RGSVYEILKILSITGGIPWYLSLIHPKESADQNIYALCFGKASQLVNEFQTVFHDLFDNRGETYRKILHLLVDGMKTQSEIRTLLGFQEGGTVSRYLKHLVEAGFLSEHYQWSLKQARVGKQKLYRLSDCFIRFHLKYVEPHMSRIKQGAYESVAKGLLPGWDTIMGFQVESLLLANRQFLFDAIGIHAEQVVCDNPFFQSPTTRKKGCQIDYLIQTRLQSLIVCEFKFRKHELSAAIVKEMEEKVRLLATPRGFGVAMVLFHLGGVAPQVEESAVFYRLVDLREVLDLKNHDD
ncbi:MAG: winged helix-turn-helix transcriptional regulator, partial [Verrucomicrobia bacterium]|nr:winged helix-turn-helix transcriptional regulator [Verrucomicrobiota bacterium]